MATTGPQMDRKEAVDTIARIADLPRIAEELGLRVIGRNSSRARALCPFHDDRTPSLSFFRGDKSERGLFQCFACGAHGDVFDLVKKLRNDCSFPDALTWLAEYYHQSLPAPMRMKSPGVDPRNVGFELASEIYRNQTSDETGRFRDWARVRNFEPSFLRKAGVSYSNPPKLGTNEKTADREALDALQAAGLIIRNSTRYSGQAVLPLQLKPRDFFSTPRTIFTIRDERGKIVGFAGRAVGDDTPKYLYSPKFPRAKTLYRLEEVYSKLRLERPKQADVFVVEGLMDVLRLESIGLLAVGALGSQLTDDQIGLLSKLSAELEREKVPLVVHLFLDADDAGRRGSLNALPRLLLRASEESGFLVNVIVPPNSPGKHDPDELFQGVVDRETAFAKLRPWSWAPLEVMLAGAIEASPTELEVVWPKLSAGQRQVAFRSLERQLDHLEWMRVLDRTQPFGSSLKNQDAEQRTDWRARLDAFLRASFIAPLPDEEEIPVAVDFDDKARLLRAIQIAQSSTQRRELPVDEGSWDRLQIAVDVTLPYLSGMLGKGGAPDEPMMAIKIPKASGGLRLKALPCPETLSLQQYLLNELLRDYPESPSFRKLIPAVRYVRGVRGPRVLTTGRSDMVPQNGETVSFAYQIDMDVLEGRVPPRREGMFRPYFPCWQDFVAFIDRRVSGCRFDLFHVARLDVRSFYDSVRRSTVIDMLRQPLTDALKDLALTNDRGAVRCGELYVPEVAEAERRAMHLIDWLCDQSFEFRYEDPGTGEPIRRNHGIPQGPDLSAYLANISLFPVDRAMTDLVAELDRAAQAESGKGALGGVYARYVDDMIIVAPTAHDLARMRTAVEQQLGKLGLELSPKNEPLPAMSAAEVREWLTDRRGGLGISGPFDGPPESSPFLNSDPLADAGEIDRTASLAILHDPLLDDPDTQSGEVQEAVTSARNADEVRHGDQVVAARHLWRCVLQNILPEDDSPDDFASEFRRLWGTTAPFGDGIKSDQQCSDINQLLVWLEGLERFLQARHDRSPRFDDKQRSKIEKFRQRLANSVHAGLCNILVDGIPKPLREPMQHMIDLRTLTIHRGANLVISSPEPIHLRYDRPVSYSQARLLISIAQAKRSAEKFEQSRLQGSKYSDLLLFHEAIARLIVANVPEKPTRDPGQGPVDPLQPMVSLWVNKGPRKGETLKLLEGVLELWLPDARHDFLDEDVSRIAITALNKLVHHNLTDFLSKRSRLENLILGGGKRWDGIILRTPPAIGTPGILGVSRNKRNVHRVDLETPPLDAFSPADLQWTENTEKVGFSAGKAFKAPFDGRSFLSPLSNKQDASPKMLKWVATVFRNLAAQVPDDDSVCPPTAENLVGPGIDEFQDNSTWEVFGYKAHRSRLGAQAFIRSGFDGLVAEAVTKEHDDLWRIGTALADYLERVETSKSISSMRFSAPANVTRQGADWASEAMLRFALARLRGVELQGGPLMLDSKSRLPRTVERVLSRLSKFPEPLPNSNDFAGVAHLVATLATGRAFQARRDLPFDPTMPGGAAALLADLVRPQFRLDDEMTEHFPRGWESLPIWAPKRRPPLAWLCISSRLDELIKHDPESANDASLSALAAGASILAVESQLRAQALEQWVLVDEAKREAILTALPDLGAWGLDSTALLHRRQERPVEKDASNTGDEQNVRFLFEQLRDATVPESVGSWPTLSYITPLGWAVIVATLVGALPGGAHGRGTIASGPDVTDFSWFGELAKKLAAAAEISDDPPWGGLENAVTTWTREVVAEAFTNLRGLDDLTGIEVRCPAASSEFLLKVSRKGTAEVRSTEGLRIIRSWMVSAARVQGEKNGGVERFRKGDSLLSRWTECWCGDRIVSIGVVQPGLASLAEMPDTVEAPIESVPQSIRRDEIISSPLPDELPIAAAKEPVKPFLEVPLVHPSAEEALSRPKVERSPRTISSEGQESPLTVLRRYQDQCWPKRRMKPARQGRIALFQWDVDDSYFHPVTEICGRQDRDFRKRLSSSPSDWHESREAASCSEHRRRKLLSEVLRACNLFKVDVLLLPEYSTRPDTIFWLREHLPELAPETSVWAGTYRNAPYSTRSLFPRPEPDAWNAVLPVLLPNKDSFEALWRAKKYPSVAVKEIFNPWSEELVPIFTSTPTRFDIRSHLMELICSEVFLVTSPSNLPSMIVAVRHLMDKFGADAASWTRGHLRQEVLRDVWNFAERTGFESEHLVRRSILLVPAMTQRSVDYAVLGQAGFLASGLTTVFCNAAGTLCRGESCFIGHDGWGQDHTDEAAMPLPGPYHGVQPGIYHHNHPGRGVLGKKEQALVIADIDPEHSIEGKPRPQTLLTPLTLVAHLPVIESWRPLRADDTEPWMCRCLSHRHNPKFMDNVASRIQCAIQRTGLHSTVDDEIPNQLQDILMELARLISPDPNSWLHQRSAAYLKEHAANPQPWPPPAALDWLWVDLGEPDASRFAKIEVPPYSQPPA